METYNDIYLNARKKLRSAGIAAHDLEARLIVASAAGKTREELLSSSRLFVTDEKVIDNVDRMIGRRLEGEPVAYLVGEWEFYGIPLLVNSSVIVPRTDTEVLAGEAIKYMRQRSAQARILDLCAGCGCVGLAVAANARECRVVLVDNSEGALALCRANMLKNRLSSSVTAVNADALAEPPALLGVFDAIACNPPYIPTSELDALDLSVRNFEPRGALDGGDDGLQFFRFVASAWKQLLKQGGALMFECGAGQAAALRGVMRDNGFIGIKTHLDTLGVERVVSGRKGA